MHVCTVSMLESEFIMCLCDVCRWTSCSSLMLRGLRSNRNNHLL